MKHLECFAIGRSSGRGEFAAFECYDDLFAEIRRLFDLDDEHGELMIKKTAIPVSEAPHWISIREKRRDKKLAHYKDCHTQGCEACEEVEEILKENL